MSNLFGSATKKAAKKHVDSPMVMTAQSSSATFMARLVGDTSTSQSQEDPFNISALGVPLADRRSQRQSRNEASAAAALAREMMEQDAIADLGAERIQTSPQTNLELALAHQEGLEEQEEEDIGDEEQSEVSGRASEIAAQMRASPMQLAVQETPTKKATSEPVPTIAASSAFGHQTGYGELLRQTHSMEKVSEKLGTVTIASSAHPTQKVVSVFPITCTNPAVHRYIVMQALQNRNVQDAYSVCPPDYQQVLDRAHLALEGLEGNTLLALTDVLALLRLTLHSNIEQSKKVEVLKQQLNSLEAAQGSQRTTFEEAVHTLQNRIKELERREGSRELPAQGGEGVFTIPASRHLNVSSFQPGAKAPSSPSPFGVSLPITQPKISALTGLFSAADTKSVSSSGSSGLLKRAAQGVTHILPKRKQAKQTTKSADVNYDPDA